MREVGSLFAIGFRIQPLSRMPHGYFVGGDRGLLAQEVATPVSDLVAPEESGAHRHAALGRNVETQNHIQVKDVGLQFVELAPQIDSLPGEFRPRAFQRSYA